MPGAFKHLSFLLISFFIMVQPILFLCLVFQIKDFNLFDFLPCLIIEDQGVNALSFREISLKTSNYSLSSWSLKSWKDQQSVLRRWYLLWTDILYHVILFSASETHSPFSQTLEFLQNSISKILTMVFYSFLVKLPPNVLYVCSFVIFPSSGATIIWEAVLGGG